ncbi:phosphatidylglycerol lysyltransferase domain-containing protein [Brachyspira hyodysenteriae]|uniref:Phosphatidylglycerol lysyltransferase C-terminal domain-containing protein n=1 Tax=Brachyspira hyodysenteriae ATCC 27164 TaxID=1266923 RepID=A0A3B6VYM5_BRAHO|nr:phosphatidylglycerol lysyltransferase domain-containing protein [Brachyspira hyodysenteriae]ANN62499.1 hypothetical protein BHYOB78_01090 [Brachyspira hyodysenteriae ATCC 27164]KLI17200.1 hypothetical protein SU44_03970 [Brachyspira hyodysenteriae]KLI20525.1 hypothetical protein SU46_04105 [Brachyspira hyodysenteriae]KLI20792.1 hypothetical protein SU43_11025 [Brachyspira hyodysenteriae]KLI26161.1 hypothetical protein SR30_05290 [Brachyspira hyodysenteriae]
MINFEPISLEKQELYHKYFSITPEQSADYTFMNLLGLKDIYMLEWAFTEKLVWIRQKSPYTIYWAPVGDWFNTNFCTDFSPCEISGETIIRIPKELALFWEKTTKIKVKETRDEWEYLYDFNELVTLPGKKFHNKKNLYNQFLKNEFKYVTIDNKTVINDILDFEAKWEEEEKKNNAALNENNAEECETFDSTKLLTHEVRAEADTIMIKTLLGNWDIINNISGGAIYIDNKIVAYTIADLSMRDTIVVHSERGDRNYKGTYQAINRMFLENLKDNINDYERFKFVNREQDVGDLGLRKAKMSYNPVGYIEKYKGFCTEF